ncbi:MAG: hypothetical protein MUF64_10385 [Polyangiaceae bacterium]|nr:hypothetical protein [Polyangiaceae bacterium]
MRSPATPRLLLQGAASLLALVLSACESAPPPRGPADTRTSGPTPCPESGTPCSKEGDSCGADAANKATTFSWVVRCQGGKWTRIEVPPPPPPS